MFRYLGVFTFFLIFFCSVILVQAAPARLKPPVWVEMTPSVDLNGVKPGEEAELTIRCHVTADLEKFTLFYDKDAAIDILSGDPIERTGVAADDIIETKVRVRLNKESGKLTVYYNTYFSFGHIGDSMLVTVGSESAP